MTKKAKILGYIIFSIVIITILSTLIPIYFVLINAPEQEDLTSEFAITGYDVDAVVREDNSLVITEKIDVEFIIRSHGIFRYFPCYQTVSFEEDGKTLKKSYENTVNIISCNKEYDFYIEDNSYIVQIGEANRYANTNETYLISYVIELGDDKISDFDQLYYNFIGTGWGTTISNININVSFEKDVENGKQVFFYVGQEGEDLCFTTQVSGNAFSFSYAETLQPYKGITARVKLAEGYFDVKKQSNVFDIVFLVLSILITVAAVLVFMAKKNKNKIIPIVEFSAPNGLTPADAGYIIDETINRGDISSLIVYWASKGFIKINDSEEKTTLTKIKDADKSFKEYEKKIFNAMFKKEDVYDIKSENFDVALAIQKAKQEIAKENDKFFSKKIKSIRTFLIFAFSILVSVMYRIIGTKVVPGSFETGHCILIFFGIIVLSSVLISLKSKSQTIKKPIYIVMLSLNIIGFLALYCSLAVKCFDSYSNPLMTTIFAPLILFGLIIISMLLEVRVEGSEKEIGRMYGLRNFILLTEKDRIKMLANENPELFYNILPYAYVLGISDVWIKKFNDIEIKNPDWYSSSETFVGIHVTIRIFNSVKTFNNSIGKTISTAQSRGMSGFGGGGHHSGGGHSGGGHGGGGGGRW